MVVGSLFTSCEKVEDPYEGILKSACERIPQAENIWGDTANTTVRKMLIEEITGHTCGNCPPKTKLINDWVDSTYVDQVYSVAIHATSFADPVRGYDADYRTAKGTEYNESLKNTDAPVASFNRFDLGSDGLLVGGTKFESEFEALVSSGMLQNPSVQLLVHNQWDRANNVNQLGVTVRALNEIVGDHTVVIHIIEQGVISKQKYYGYIVDGQIKGYKEDYEHKHMFRDAVGSMDGSSLISGGLQVGEQVEKCFTYSLDPAWNALNCYYVVSVRNNETGEIIQADKVAATIE